MTVIHPGEGGVLCVRPLVIASALAMLALCASARSHEDPTPPAGSGQEEPEDDWQAIVRLMHLTRDRSAPPVSDLVLQVAPHVEKLLPRVLGILYERIAPPLA